MTLQQPENPDRGSLPGLGRRGAGGLPGGGKARPETWAGSWRGQVEWNVGPGELWWGVFSSFQGHWDPTGGLEDPRLHTPHPPKAACLPAIPRASPTPIHTIPQLTFLLVPKGNLPSSTGLLRKKMYQ